MKEELTDLLSNPSVVRVLTVLIGIVVIWLFIKIIQRNLFTRIQDADNRYRAKKAGGFIGYFLTFVLILVVFSSKLSGFTVALGVAGAGIAFALQEVITSFAGWLAIIFGGFYKTGDRVQLGGIKGDIMDIGVLRTTIMEVGQWVDGDLYNGRIVLIANSFVFKEPVFNYSGDFPFLWDEIKIPVQYGSNYEMTKEMLLEVGNEVVDGLPQQSKEKWKNLQKNYKLENAKTDPMVSLIANDNWVEFTLRFVVDFKKRRMTKTELFTRILKKVNESNGQIKLASATFHLVEAADLNVNLRQKEDTR